LVPFRGPRGTMEGGTGRWSRPGDHPSREVIVWTSPPLLCLSLSSLS
jgi:hypothetical protein